MLALPAIIEWLESGELTPAEAVAVCHLGSKSCRQKTKVRDRIQPWGRAKTNLGTFFDGPPDPKPFW